MKRILLSALALGAMTTAAMAEPQKMTDDQMGDVAAGLNVNISQVSNQAMVINALALGTGGISTATVKGAQTANQTAVINAAELVSALPLPLGSSSLNVQSINDSHNWAAADAVSSAAQ